jgi:DcmR-like sensory protein
LANRRKPGRAASSAGQKPCHRAASRLGSLGFSRKCNRYETCIALVGCTSCYLFERSEMTSGHDVFWGEMASCDHFVQIYDHGDALLDALESFVANGLRADEGVLVIATPRHLNALEHRLIASGLDLANLGYRNRYIAMDAEDTLSRFMVDGWPDEKRFVAVVTSLLSRVGAPMRPVRAFGEMVALLWAQGHRGATIRLELLWHALCEKRGLSLFCAYPRVGFTKDPESSIREICAAHSRVIGDLALQ